MSVVRRSRFVFWLARELSHKYTKALVLGVTLGVVGALLLWKLTPYIQETWLTPVDHIGIVGEFTPSTLPLSIQQFISKGLTTLAPDGSIRPGIASSWEATDSGKTYVFTLSSNLTWHNGTEVKPSDVNYNIADVQFTPINNNQIKVTLKDPFSPFLALVSKPILLRGLIGMGDYKVIGLQLKGDAIQLLRLAQVANSLGKVKEYRFYRTETQAIAAYKLGDIDSIEDVSSPEDLSKWGKTVITTNIHYDRIVSVFFNTKEPILSERTMRQALGFAIPEIDEERAYSPISKTSWAYSDNVKKYTNNSAQAKKLFANAKIASNSSELVLTTFAPYADLAQSIAKSWTDNGIPTKIKIENVLPDTYQVVLAAQTIPPDPDQYSLWHSTQQRTNRTNYVNVKVDKLLEDARRKEIDPEKRKKLYADFQRVLVEDAPAIFLYYPKTYTIKRG